MPQDAVVAGEYKASIAKFNQTAKQWTQQYAMGDNKEALKPLMDMGFSEDQARAALNEVGGDVQAAVEKLLTGA
jgi:ubiquitin-conjugating enzyme (huntingtin interacting protein 2)